MIWSSYALCNDYIDEACNRLIKVFNEKYPNIEFVNTAVAGGCSADVTAALENFSKALSYTNSDAAQLADWQSAA